MEEVKKLYAPVKFTLEDAAKGKLKVKNEWLFTSLEHHDLEWTISSENGISQSGMLSLKTKGDSEESINLPYALADLDTQHDHFLNISTTFFFNIVHFKVIWLGIYNKCFILDSIKNY